MEGEFRGDAQSTRHSTHGSDVGSLNSSNEFAELDREIEEDMLTPPPLVEGSPDNTFGGSSHWDSEVNSIIRRHLKPKVSQGFECCRDSAEDLTPSPRCGRKPWKMERIRGQNPDQHSEMGMDLCRMEVEDEPVSHPGPPSCTNESTARMSELSNESPTSQRADNRQEFGLPVGSTPLSLPLPMSTPLDERQVIQLTLEEAQAKKAADAKKARVLNLLSSIRVKLESTDLDIPIPQFILVGLQSVGKSRLIETLSGEAFNFCSGTIGSRRPTVLEFRHSEKPPSRWMVHADNEWQTGTPEDIQKYVSRFHEKCGSDVSYDPVNIQVHSPYCEDMCIVDLPGFREYSGNDHQLAFKQKIDTLVESYMANPRNHIIVVEECGDAANLLALNRAKKFDPDFRRTTLVRTKLDKYYSDLETLDVDYWLKGCGDLPPNMMAYALTLPNGNRLKTESFVSVRQDMDARDRAELIHKCQNPRNTHFIGFRCLAAGLSLLTERAFSRSIAPVMDFLHFKRDQLLYEQTDLKVRIQQHDPDAISDHLRNIGQKFCSGVIAVLERPYVLPAAKSSVHDLLMGFDQAYPNAHPSLSVEEYINQIQQTYLSRLYAMDCGSARITNLIQELALILPEMLNIENVPSSEFLIARSWREHLTTRLHHEYMPIFERCFEYLEKRYQYFFQCHLDNVAASLVRDSMIKHYTGSLKEQINKQYFDLVHEHLTTYLGTMRKNVENNLGHPWQQVATLMKLRPVEQPRKSPRLHRTLRDQMGTKKDVVKLDDIEEALIQKYGTLHGFSPPTADVSELMKPIAEAARRDLMAQFRAFAEMAFGEAIIDRFRIGLMGMSLSEPERKQFKLELREMQKAMEINESNVAICRECLKEMEIYAAH